MPSLPPSFQIAAKADEAVTIRFDASGKPVVSVGSAAPAPVKAADEVSGGMGGRGRAGSSLAAPAFCAARLRAPLTAACCEG